MRRKGKIYLKKSNNKKNYAFHIFYNTNLIYVNIHMEMVFQAFGCQKYVIYIKNYGDSKNIDNYIFWFLIVYFEYEQVQGNIQPKPID